MRETVDALGASMQKEHDAQAERIARLESCIASNFSSQESAMQAKLSSIEQALEMRSPISADKISTMQELLQEIKQHVTTTSPRPSNSATTSANETHPSSCDDVRPDSDDKPVHPVIDKEMIDSIDRLCRLVYDTERCIDTYTDDDDEANRIIEDMQNILRSARKHCEHIQLTQINSTLAEGDKAAEAFDRSLHRFSRSFGHSQLSINQEGEKQTVPQ